MRMKGLSRFIPLGLVFATFGLTAPGAMAQTDTWNMNSSANWSDAGNWTTMPGPNRAPISGDDVVLTNTTPLNSSYDLAATLHSVTLSSTVSGNYVINLVGPGHFLGLQSGGSINDQHVGLGTPNDTFATGLTLNGPATIASSGGSILAFTNPIIGTGPLTLVTINAGFIVLQSANSYTGATIISAGNGRVKASVNGAIPITSALTVNAGGGIVFGQSSTIGSLAGGGNVFVGTLALGTLTTGGDNTSTTFSGILQNGFFATGALTKTGSGTMTLTGTNTYTGPTTVAGGTLVVNGSIASSSLTTVNAGATLGGTGMVRATTVNGTIAPGPVGGIGTLNVKGAYTQNASSTFQVNTAGAASNHLQITGTATLGGTVVANGTGTPGTTFTILTASGGLGGTTFAGVTDNIPFTAAQLTYDPNDVFLVLTANPNQLINLGQTGNQRSTAAGLGMSALAVQVLGLSPSQIPFALDQLSGEIYASNVSAGLENQGLFLRTLAERLRQSRCLCGVDAPAPGCETEDGWRTWATPFGQIGSTTGNDNSHGFTFDSVGFAMGADRWLGSSTLVGLALGYDNWFNRTHDIDSRADVDSLQLALYGYQQLGYLWLLGTVSYEYDGYDTRRPIDFLAVTAQGDYSGNQVGTYLETGYDLLLWRSLHLQPIAALQYISLWRDAFSETGAGTADLRVNSARADSFRSYLGGRLMMPLGANRCWLPEARAFWVHEYAADTRDITNTFEGGGPAFLIRGSNLGRDWGLFGLGLSAQVSNAIRVGLHYDAWVTENGQAHGGWGQVQVSW
jgi:autotransporter-associated beta strand protein